MNAQQIACPKCGQVQARAAATCLKCGAPLHAQTPIPSSLRPTMPPQGYAPPGYAMPYPTQRKRNGWLWGLLAIPAICLVGVIVPSKPSDKGFDVVVYDSTVGFTYFSVANNTGNSVYDVRLKAKEGIVYDSGGPRPYGEVLDIPFSATLVNSEESEEATLKPKDTVRFQLPILVSVLERRSVELIYKTRPNGIDEHLFPTYAIRPFSGRTY